MPGGAPYDAREVGNFVLKLAIKSATPLTQMALLKIIYYAHGWYLALKDAPLFRQPVEAWEHGPVVKVVRDAFKEFGKRPIDKFAERLDLQTGELVLVGSQLNFEDEVFVEGIFDTYIKYSAFQLSDMTHENGSPWDKVWNTRAAIGRLGLRIKNEEIRDYFLKIEAGEALH